MYEMHAAHAELYAMCTTNRLLAQVKVYFRTLRFVYICPLKVLRTCPGSTLHVQLSRSVGAALLLDVFIPEPALSGYHAA
jgi:hypothetical protein